jgi:hypothetical protein
VTSIAEHLVGTNTMLARTATLYDKTHATFSSVIAVIRHCLWRACHFSTSQAEADVEKIPHVLFACLTNALC